MISRDKQDRSLVCSNRYESPSAWHEDRARLSESKLGETYFMRGAVEGDIRPFFA
jgi:hypothetical protein